MYISYQHHRVFTVMHLDHQTAQPPPTNTQSAYLTWWT